MKTLIISYALGLFIPIIEIIDLLLKLVLRSRVSRIDREGHASPTSVKLSEGESESGENPGVRPYKILVSVRNIAPEFDTFSENLGRFGYANVHVIDDHSSDDTSELLRKAGIPFSRNEENLQKPGSILKALQELPDDIKTIVVIDPDARILNLNPREFSKTVSDFQEVLADFQKSGYDACAVRVVANCNSFLEKMQNFEYKLTMGLTKKSLRHYVAVSGALAFYDRACLERVLQKHSKSVYGEDYESSLLIHAGHGKAYYDGRLTVLTSQRPTLKELTKQRMGWDLSLLKIHLQQLKTLKSIPKRPLYLYQYLLYNTIYLIVFHPVRMLSVVFVMLSFANLVDNAAFEAIPDYYFNDPIICVSFYGFSLIYTYLILLACERRRRKRYLLLALAYPLYGLYLALVPKTLGYLNYLSLVLFKRKLLEDGYNSALRQPLLG
jgi:hypothetical protein